MVPLARSELILADRVDGPCGDPILVVLNELHQVVNIVRTEAGVGVLGRLDRRELAA